MATAPLVESSSSGPGPAGTPATFRGMVEGNGGALRARVERLERDVEGLYNELRGHKLDGLAVMVQNQGEDLHEVKAEVVWIKRTVITTLVTLAIGAVLLAANLATGALGPSH